jgi:hypothetical protein
LRSCVASLLIWRPVSTKILRLRTKYPRDLKPAELEPLAEELRSVVGPEVQVVVDQVEDEHRVGVTFIEILDVIADFATTGAFLGGVTAGLRAWMKNRSRQLGDHRPRCVNILGPDGRPVRRVELDADAEDASVVDVPEKKKKSG